jgi:hypothetical protein
MENHLELMEYQQHVKDYFIIINHCHSFILRRDVGVNGGVSHVSLSQGSC